MGVFFLGMEVDRHFVKNGAFGRRVYEIVGVLLCDTQIIIWAFAKPVMRMMKRRSQNIGKNAQVIDLSSFIRLCD